MSTGEPELELTRVSFQVPAPGSRTPVRPVTADLTQAHIIQLEDRIFELDLGLVGGEDPRSRLALHRSNYWEEAKAFLESQLPHADKLWRVAAFAGHGAMALSRVGGYLSEGDPPVKDVRMDTVLPNRLLATLAGPSEARASGETRAEARIQAWEAHLDTAVSAAKSRLEPLCPWLPLSVHGDCSSYFLEPLPLDWLQGLGAGNHPPGLKASYLLDLERSAILFGSAYTSELETVSALWQKTLGLGESAGVGKTSCLYLLGAQNLLVMEPTRQGTSLLVTVWYKTIPVPQLLLASRRILRALEPRSTRGLGPPTGRVIRQVPEPSPAAGGQVPGSTYVGILDFKKSLLEMEALP